MNVPGEMAEEAELFETIDLRQYLKVLTKWRWMIAILTAGAVLTAGIMSFFVLPPVYETKTVLMATQAVEKQTTSYQRQELEDVVGQLSRIPLMTINTYVGQLKSPALLETVIQKMNLDPQIYTLKAISNMIEVKAIKDTNLIEITVSDTDPVLAANLANTLRQEFLKFISQSNQEQMNKSVEFLNNQIELERRNLEESSKKLQEIEAKPRGISFLEKELQARMDDLSKNKAQLNQLQIELRQLEAGKAQAEEALEKLPPTVKVRRVSDANPGIVVESEEVNPAYTSAQDNLRSKTIALAEKEAAMMAAQDVVMQLESEIEGLQTELSEKRLEVDQVKADVEQAKSTYNLLREKNITTQIAKSINLGETT
ncbi:MAG: Wzz/FepE/Etk N-terminal domain-containing protein, partial [Syntrophomonadaceae bacterium]|nr:Wzz/FepE/Etk N-terminal domain-containing protein [Syntrophomonadaceae bacterium]